jgi:two-component system, LuxR family, response regulator TtrR
MPYNPGSFFGQTTENLETQMGRAKNGGKPPKLGMVFVLDDDLSQVDTIRDFLESVDFTCKTFTEPRKCIDSIAKGGCDVLLCDLSMPEMDGHQVFSEVHSKRPGLPIVIITGYGTVPIAVSAMKKGLFNFIEKPFDGDSLVEIINAAIRQSRKASTTTEVKLSKREKAVLRLILRGMGNKGIAGKLEISVRTVEDHRGHLMQKLGASNLVDLVKRAIELGFDKVEPEKGTTTD